MASTIGDGFRYIKSRFSLVRKVDNGSQIITIDLLPTSSSKHKKVSMFAHIRMDQLEEQYGPFHPFLDEKSRKTNSTVVINCDYLITDKSLTNSIQVDDSTLDQISHIYAKAIQNDVIPFFKEYFSIQSIVKSFERSDPCSWITSDKNTRYLVLLSAYSLESRWDDFDKVASEYLKYCEKPFSRQYSVLAESVINGLREKLDN